MKILIVEDEKALANDIITYLKPEGFRCEWAANFEEGRDKILHHEYDCVLLDVMLPDGNGLDLLKQLRQTDSIAGVIILSAKGSIEDKVEGLNLGSDDYLPKPFHHAELMARIQSLVRRKQFGGNERILFNELEINLSSKTLWVRGSEVVLTKKEFELLLFFLGNKNRVLSKSTLAEHLSGDMAELFDNHDFVYAHVKNLKKKLREYDVHEYINTVYGYGYKWLG